jgi:hypothetical protein
MRFGMEVEGETQVLGCNLLIEKLDKIICPSMQTVFHRTPEAGVREERGKTDGGRTNVCSHPAFVLI